MLESAPDAGPDTDSNTDSLTTTRRLPETIRWP
jgi:hypothetical protein